MTKRLIYRFAHCADIHLGARPRSIRRRKLDIFDSYIAMCKDIASRKVDAVIMAGDVLHTKMVDFETSSKLREGLEIISSSFQISEIIAIPGNHDYVADFDWINHYAYYLTRPSEINYKFDSWNTYSSINIYPIPWGTIKDNVELIKKYYEQANPEEFNVLVCHQAVEGHIYGDNKNVSSLSLEFIQSIRDRFSYIALGHIHHSYVADGIAFNPGSIEYLTVGDWGANTGYFLVSVYDDHSFDYELIPTLKRSTFHLKIDTSKMKTIDKSKICGIINKQATPESCIYIEFTGTLDVPHRVLKEIQSYIIKAMNPVFIKIGTNTKPPILQLEEVEDADYYVSIFGEDASRAKEIVNNYKESDKVIEIL